MGEEQRTLHWGTAGRWGGARKEAGDLEFILKARSGGLHGVEGGYLEGNKRGHYEDPSISSVIGIEGPL